MYLIARLLRQCRKNKCRHCVTERLLSCFVEYNDNDNISFEKTISSIFLLHLSLLYGVKWMKFYKIKVITQDFLKCTFTKIRKIIKN